MVCRRLVLYTLLLLFFSSCGKAELMYTDYVSYLEDIDNGLHKKRKLNGVQVEVQYVPHELMAYRGEEVEQEVFEQQLNEFKGMAYFKVQLSVKEGGSVEELLTSNGIDNPIYYLSYLLEKEVYLETTNGKEFAKLYHFERSNGLSKNKTIMMGFEDSTPYDKILVINAEGLNTGPIKIAFSQNDLNNIPKLKIG